MIYVVLGMHKSGTTLVARMLHESGIDMGEFDDDLGYTEGNTFERHEAQAVNRAILRGCLLPPLDHLLRRPFRPSIDAAGYPANRDSQSIIRHRAIGRRLARPEAARSVDAVIQACRDHADWGFKDPRTALTYPIWRDRLPEHRLVVVYRGLSQVLERARAGIRHPARSFRTLHAWTVHNWLILRALEQTRLPFLVLRYEELMSGDEGIKRLAAFVGRPLEDARDPALYRRRSAAAPPRWTSPLAAALPIAPSVLEARLKELSERGTP